MLWFVPSEFFRVLVILARSHLVRSHKKYRVLCGQNSPILSGLSGVFPLPTNLSRSDAYWPVSLMACPLFIVGGRPDELDEYRVLWVKPATELCVLSGHRESNPVAKLPAVSWRCPCASSAFFSRVRKAFFNLISFSFFLSLFLWMVLWLMSMWVYLVRMNYVC